jgi:hypothetical protein
MRSEQRSTEEPGGPAGPTALDLYERYGTDTYAFARLLVDDEDDAVPLAAHALLDASGGRDASVDERRLARHLYVLATWSRSSRPDHRHPSPLTWAQRTAIGLAVFGRHDYREIADLMDITPEASAQLLRSGLLRVAAT